MVENEEGNFSVANFVLQLLAIGLAVLFGVYTVLAYPISKSSLQQAQIANQLTLLSFCTSAGIGNESWASPCSEVVQNVNLTDIATILLPPSTPTSPTSPNPPTKNPTKSLSNSDKIAIGVGVGFGFPGIITTIISFVQTRNRRHDY